MNIGSQDEYTLLQLAETVIEVAGRARDRLRVAARRRSPRSASPTSPGPQLLGWEPTVSLRDGLKKTIEESGVERLVGQPG